MLHFWPILLLVVFKKEEIRQRRVEHIRSISRHGNEIESLLTTIAPAPKSLLHLLIPRRSRIALYGEQVQRHASEHLHRRLRDVVRRHDDIATLRRTAPRKNRQKRTRNRDGIIAQIDEEFDVRKPNFSRQRQQNRVAELFEADDTTERRAINPILDDRVVSEAPVAESIPHRRHGRVQIDRSDVEMGQARAHLRLARSTVHRRSPRGRISRRTRAIFVTHGPDESIGRRVEMNAVAVRYFDVYFVVRRVEAIANDERSVSPIELVDPHANASRIARGFSAHANDERFDARRRRVAAENRFIE